MVLTVFQIVILEHKSIICAGYSAVMHIHCSAEEVTIKVSTSWGRFRRNSGVDVGLEIAV